MNEKNQEMWLIDFERSGPGPIVEDWVELETDILTRLCCFSASQRQEYLDLVTCLLSPDPREFWQPVSSGAFNPEATKALTVIAEIRQQAEKTTGLGEDTRLYRWALLLNVIFRLTLPVGKKDVDVVECDFPMAERCALLGGVICRSLESAGSRWPPKEWKSPLNDQKKDQPKIKHDRSDCIVIVTVNEKEATAVLEVFYQTSDKTVQREHKGNKTYYRLPDIGNIRVYMVQSEMGNTEPGAARATVDKAIRDLRSRAVIMCGVAYGLQPKKQRLGDVLVSKQILNYEIQKVDTARGVISRGSKPHASELLLDRFRSGALDWKLAPVHFGLVLSGEKLINDKTFRDQLLKDEPEAIGGEMEGFGLYTAAQEAKKDWILVKAICDWADGNKNDDAQSLAARNAAEFVKHVLETGGF